MIDRAVLAAKNAFPGWSSLSVPSRAEYLMKAANKIEQRLEEFAIAESRDQGKPLSLALKVDIPRVLTNLRAFAEGQKHLLETSNSMVGVRVKRTNKVSSVYLLMKSFLSLFVNGLETR